MTRTLGCSGGVIATGAVDDGFALAPEHEFLARGEEAERANLGRGGGVQTFEREGAQRIVHTEHGEVLEPIGDWAWTSLEEDVWDEERLGERHRNQRFAQAFECDDVLQEWTQDIFAQVVHDTKIDRHELVDEVTLRLGVVRYHHAALEQPRRAQRRLVTVHRTKRIAVETIAV